MQIGIWANRDEKVIGGPAGFPLVLLLVALALLLVPATAMAQGSERSNLAPTDEQYTDTSNQVMSLTASGGSSETSGSLPFTGFDVGISLLVAALLIGGGLALRRTTRPASADRTGR